MNTSDKKSPNKKENIQNARESNKAKVHKDWIESGHKKEIRDESNFWGIDDGGEG
ncbi:MAG: hypothetical protein IIA61_01815 [Candidatus Marinimicrobia bacterium]|nr:hypothetical protein [Candidatus Neomarinimicrobiota bacterium]